MGSWRWCFFDTHGRITVPGALAEDVVVEEHEHRGRRYGRLLWQGKPSPRPGSGQLCPLQQPVRAAV